MEGGSGKKDVLRTVRIRREKDEGRLDGDGKAHWLLQTRVEEIEREVDTQGVYRVGDHALAG